MHTRLTGILTVCLLCLTSLTVAAQTDERCARYTATLPAPPHTVIVTDEDRARAAEDALDLATRTVVGTYAHNALLRAIGETLKPHLPDYALLWDFDYIVFPKDRAYADAQVRPGGVIIFSTETFAVAPNVDILAVINAHEMGHVVLDTMVRERLHAARMFARYETLALAGQNVTDPDALRELDAERIAAFASAIDEQTIRRELEFEADIFAAHIAYRAGYDLGAAAEYLEKMAALHPDAALNDHPTFADRAALLRCFARPTAETHAPLREALKQLQNDMRERTDTR